MRPEIIVTDLTFVGDDLAGLALMKRIAARLPASRLMVFSMHNDPAIVSQALSSGALCYVLKDAPSGEFATAFERILEGKPHLAHDLAVSVAMLRSKLAHRLPGLTERENEIFQLLGAATVTTGSPPASHHGQDHHQRDVHNARETRNGFARGADFLCPQISAVQQCAYCFLRLSDWESSLP